MTTPMTEDAKLSPIHAPTVYRTSNVAISSAAAISSGR